MKKLLILFSVLFALGAAAQSTTITSTIIDPLGNSWGYGTVTAVFQPAPGASNKPVWSGGTLNPIPPAVALDSSGHFTMSLPSTNAITPSGGTWIFSVCPNSSQPCAVLPTAVVGSTLDINPLITAANGWPSQLVASTPIAKVYNVDQTFPPPLSQGGMLYDTTTQSMLVYTNTGWQPFATVGSGVPILSNPPGSQTITQPINTSFNFTTSGTGGVFNNGNQLIYNNFASAITFLSSVTAPTLVASTSVTSPDVNNTIYVFPTPGNFDVSTGIIAAQASSACSGSGCTIVVANGGYPSTSWGTVVDITNANVHLTCQSKNPITFGPGYPYDALLITGANVEVDGCSWDATNMSNHQVIGVGADKVKLHGLSIIDSKTPSCCSETLGIRLDAGAAYADVYDNVVTVSYIAYSTSDNGAYDNFHDNVSNSSFQCFDFNGSGGGAEPDSYYIIFHHNQCNNDYAPGYVESARDILIDGNNFTFDSTTANGATIQIHNTLTSDFHLHVMVSNNTFSAGSGVTNAIHVFQNAADISIMNNTIRNYGGDGIVIDSTSGAPVNVLVSGNRLTDNGQISPGGGYAGIRLLQSAGNSVSQTTITQNMCNDDQATTTQIYCIQQTAAGNPGFILAIFDNTSLSGSQNFTMANLPQGCTACSINEPYLNQNNTYSGAEPIIYSGAYSFTAGSTSVVGTGATTPVCPISTALCSARSGIVQFTTGTGTLTAGVAVTINLPTRTTYYVCSVNGYSAGSTPGPIPVSTAVGVSSVGIEVNALTPSTIYQFSWQCI